MPSLTVTEKEYWQERLANKIDTKLAALAAAEPGFLERLASEARQRALHSLGLAELQAQLDALAAQEKELQRRKRQAQQAMLAVVRRVPLEEVEDFPEDSLHREVRQALDRQQAIHEAELLAEDVRGREILRWRREKDNLLDTVWLATAPPPIRDLWQRVVALLGDEQAPLEKAASALGSDRTGS